MTATSTNIQKATRFFELQYAGKIEQAFEELAAPGFNFVVGSDENDELRAAIPWAGYRHKGREGYIELTGGLFGEYEVLTFAPHRYTDGGDRVFVEGHFRFKHRQTGRIADSDWIARFDFNEDRKIGGGQFYENTFAVAAGRSESGGDGRSGSSGSGEEVK